MGKYIPKSALVAEIEKIEKALKNACEPNPFGNMEECMTAAELEVLDVVKETINTFEVIKEVNLEKEIAKYLGDDWVQDTPKEVQLDMIGYARHFFELGLNAQKGE